MDPTNFSDKSKKRKIWVVLEPMRNIKLSYDFIKGANADGKSCYLHRKLNRKCEILLCPWYLSEMFLSHPNSNTPYTRIESLLYNKLALKTGQFRLWQNSLNFDFPPSYEKKISISFIIGLFRGISWNFRLDFRDFFFALPRFSGNFRIFVFCSFSNKSQYKKLLY